MNRQHDQDSRFGLAWQAFVDEDAQTVAPAALEARVLTAVRCGRKTAASGIGHRRLASGLWLAAVCLVALASFESRSTEVREPATLGAPLVLLDTWAGYKSAVLPERAPRPDGNHRRMSTALGQRAAPTTLSPPVLMTLGAAPLRETEALQLVRLRVPRRALQGLGVALLEPDAQALVDIDVLIGEDGLPRDIRQVRAGQEWPW